MTVLKIKKRHIVQWSVAGYLNLFSNFYLADKWTHTDKDGKINILAPTTAETEGDYKLSGNVIKIEPDTKKRNMMGTISCK